MNHFTVSNAGAAWLELLQQLIVLEQRVAPRGMPIRELLSVSLEIENPQLNVITNATRNLNYRFMVAEWLWIWFGHDDVETIAKYNPKIAEFSDNGVNFNGSYGVPVRRQWPRIVETLKNDRDSRQAVLLIYQVPTGPTKDVPCTISLQFLIREGRMHCIVTMRSSDVWLGLPYDVFNFTMLQNRLAVELDCLLGPITLQLGSSHLYARDYELAVKVVREAFTVDTSLGVGALMSPYLVEEPPPLLDWVLKTHQPAFQKLEEPWRTYEQALLSQKNAEALRWLTNI